MKTRNILTLMLFSLVVLFTSCSKQPKYTKYVCDDPFVMMRFDIKQICEKSGFDAKQNKKEIDKAIKTIGGDRKMQKLLREIAEDPSKMGVDLRDPLLFVVSEDRLPFLWGSVYDDDNLEDVIETIGRDMGYKVKEKGDVDYVMLDSRSAFFFNDDVFVMTERPRNVEEHDFINDMVDLLKGENKQSESTQHSLDIINSSEGIMQLMITANAFDYVASNQKFVYGLDEYTEGLDLLFDLQAPRGELVLSTQLFAGSKQMNELMDRFDQAYGEIKGSLLDYVDTNSPALMGNLDGQKLLDIISDFVPTEVGSNGFSQFGKLLSSINGDWAMTLNNIDVQSEGFTYSILGETDSPAIINLAASTNDDVQKVGNNEYTSQGRCTYSLDWNPITDELETETTPISRFAFGYKNGISYFVDAPTSPALKKASKKLDAQVLRGKRICGRIPAKFILDIISTIPENPYVSIMTSFVKLFDSLEFNYEGKFKAVARLVLKDKDAQPLQVFTNFITDMTKKVLSGDIVFTRNDFDDYVYADTLAVDTVAYEEIDSAVSVDDYYGY